MRPGLPERVSELEEAAAALQKLGWVVTHLSLTVEDDGDRGAYPYGSITVRYDPVKPTDTL